MKIQLVKLVLLLLSIHSNAYSYEKILATLSNEEDQITTRLMADLNDSNSNFNAIYKDTIDPSGNVILHMKLNMSELVSGGIVIHKIEKHVVIKISSENFDKVTGGKIVIDTLHNGITRKRKSYSIELIKKANDWNIYHNNTPFSKIHVESLKVLGRSIGIKNLSFND